MGREFENSLPYANAIEVTTLTLLCCVYVDRELIAMVPRSIKGYGHITGSCIQGRGLAAVEKLELAVTTSTLAFGTFVDLRFHVLEWLLMKPRISWVCLIYTTYLVVQGLEFTVSCPTREYFLL